MVEKKIQMRQIYEGNKKICEIGISKLENYKGYGVDTRIIIKVDDIHVAIERARTPPNVRNVLTFYAPERFMLNMQRRFIFDEEEIS